MQAAQMTPTELQEFIAKALADLAAAVEDRNARISQTSVSMFNGLLANGKIG